MKARLAESATPGKALDRGDDVGLRLHNNSCWVVTLTTFSWYIGTPREYVTRPKDSFAFALPEGAEIGVYYEPHDEKGRELPFGSDSRSVSFLPAGRSIVFLVRKEHLRKGRDISVAFQFEWEEDQIYADYLKPPIHRLDFSFYDLPSGAGVNH